MHGWEEGGQPASHPPREGPLRVAEELWCSVATWGGGVRGAHWNRANGKENHQAWPDFPGLLPVGLGHFKARAAKITPIALRGAAGGAVGAGVQEKLLIQLQR